MIRCLTGAALEDWDNILFDKRVIVTERRVEKWNEESKSNELVVLDDLDSQAEDEYIFAFILFLFIII